jgi:hypothetical protein
MFNQRASSAALAGSTRTCAKTSRSGGGVTSVIRICAL